MSETFPKPYKHYPFQAVSSQPAKIAKLVGLNALMATALTLNANTQTAQALMSILDRISETNPHSFPSNRSVTMMALPLERQNSWVFAHRVLAKAEPCMVYTIKATAYRGNSYQSVSPHGFTSKSAMFVFTRKNWCFLFLIDFDPFWALEVEALYGCKKIVSKT